MKRAHCGFPKCTYTARSAHALYRGRLSSSREGIDLTEQELEDVKAIVVPLVKKGHSFEAIWATHAHEAPMGVEDAPTTTRMLAFSVSPTWICLVRCA